MRLLIASSFRVVNDSDMHYILLSDAFINVYRNVSGLGQVGISRDDADIPEFS